ncbi:MAG: hypothetical protein SPK00_09345 [Corynebacterium glucuronolyticum]|nr:hypothetical protein [Corynebacterium glucuronolyticum]MDD7585765.1 hypothetical protein [Mycobacteriaceae bacterium]MDY5834934.1 hypothetical protein [Corynebacterium glucuronolyticum]
MAPVVRPAISGPAGALMRLVLCPRGTFVSAYGHSTPSVATIATFAAITTGTTVMSRVFAGRGGMISTY